MQAPLKLPHTSLVTLRHVTGIGVGLLLLGAITAYVLFQARFLITGPQIELTTTPPNTTSSTTVTLQGQTRNITRLQLNGRQIFTDQNGVFEELVVLTTGINIVTIEARNRHGQTQDVMHTIVRTQ